MQAIKYLEQILIEAESQKLLAEQLKLKNAAEKSTPMEVDPATETDETIKKEEVEDVEMKDGEKSESTEEAAKNDEKDSDDSIIDIDPKTYCKLGHFHLLLEDFAKGELQREGKEESKKINYYFFSIIRLSKI